MSRVARPGAPEPLASESLRARFPHLRAAMDAETMPGLLERVLLAGRSEVRSCDRVRAEIGEHSCWLQYRLRTSSGDDVLVLGMMFESPAEAVDFEQSTLADQAARWSRRPPDALPTAVLESHALALSVFPVNGALPALVPATDSERIATILSRTLPEAPRVRGVELVELRRTRGCVLRYRLDSRAHPVVYGKVGSAPASPATSAGLDGLAASALAARGGQVYFPRALGHSADLGLTLVSEIPGRRPDLALPVERDAAVDGAASVAAALHGSGVTAGAARSIDDELARARDAVRLVLRDARGLGEALAGALDGLRSLALRTEHRPARLAHGSFAPSQLMLDGERVGILDFDRLCQAEPAHDLGRFLAPLQVTLAGLGGDGVDALATRFVTRYIEDGGAAVASDRVGLYECTALVRMAARSWLQLKRSRLRTVLGALDARLEQLGVS